MLVMSGLYVFQHETLHGSIGKYHGCINSTLSFSIISPSTWECHEYAPRSDQMKQQEIYLHSLSDIVSYNLTFIFVLISTLWLLWMVKESNIIPPTKVGGFSPQENHYPCRL
jgi:hypothetical protein